MNRSTAMSKSARQDIGAARSNLAGDPAHHHWRYGTGTANSGGTFHPFCTFCTVSSDANFHELPRFHFATTRLTLAHSPHRVVHLQLMVEVTLMADCDVLAHSLDEAVTLLVEEVQAMVPMQEVILMVPLKKHQQMQMQEGTL